MKIYQSISINSCQNVEKIKTMTLCSINFFPNIVPFMR